MSLKKFTALIGRSVHKIVHYVSVSDEEALSTGIAVFIDCVKEMVT